MGELTVRRCLSLRAGAAALTVATLVLTGCSDNQSSPTAQPSVQSRLTHIPEQPKQQPTQQPTTEHQRSAPVPPSQETPRPTAPQPSKGLIAKRAPATKQAARKAPDTTTGPLKFTRIQIQPSPGELTLQANATNTSSDYLNATTVTWRALDARGKLLATGATQLTLAPAETATINQTAPAEAGTSVKATFQLR